MPVSPLLPIDPLMGHEKIDLALATELLRHPAVVVVAVCVVIAVAAVALLLARTWKRR